MRTENSIAAGAGAENGDFHTVSLHAIALSIRLDAEKVLTMAAEKGWVEVRGTLSYLSLWKR